MGKVVKNVSKEEKEMLTKIKIQENSATKWKECKIHSDFVGILVKKETITTDTELDNDSIILREKERKYTMEVVLKADYENRKLTGLNFYKGFKCFDKEENPCSIVGYRYCIKSDKDEIDNIKLNLNDMVDFEIYHCSDDFENMKINSVISFSATCRFDFISEHKKLHFGKFKIEDISNVTVINEEELL